MRITGALYADVRSGQLCIETPDFERCIAGFSDRSAGEQGVILSHIIGSQQAHRLNSTG
jgi:hypothetical protein